MILKTDLTYTLPGSRNLFSGMCNNLSHSGIHFSTENPLSAGNSLEITIDPKSDKFRPLKAVVEVIRVDADTGSTFGVAGKIVNYK
jgi:hypothetical protein